MKVSLFKMYHTKDNVEAVAKVINRGNYWATGPEIQEFEEAIAKYVGRDYAVTFNSGTSALHAMLLAYEVDGRHRVVIPSFTFQATANSVVMVGAHPIFADIEKQTFGLSEFSVKNRKRTKVKAVMPIHYAGCPAQDTLKIKEYTEKHNLLFLEDSAQSLGARIGTQHVGSFGDAGMFSFCQDKMITTGEGGVIVTNDKSIYEKLKLYRSHGRADSKDYFSSTELFDYVTLGYNYRMPTICAALGLSQLKDIDKIIERRVNVAKHYTSLLKGCEELILQDNYRQVYQKYTIRVLNDKRDALQSYLSERGIQTKAYFGIPVHRTKYYKRKCKDVNLPVTMQMSREVLSLPIYPDLKPEEIEYVALSIKSFFNSKGGERDKTIFRERRTENQEKN